MIENKPCRQCLQGCTKPDSPRSGTRK